MSNKVSNEDIKPIPNPSTEDSKKEETGGGSGGEGGGSGTETIQNKIHPIRDFLGKDDNVNRARNAIDNDVTTKWAFDAFPFQGVVDLGDPPKQIDYIRIGSENEQPVNIDFSNDNTLTGYSGKISKTLKRGVNDIETRKDLVARYIRLEFTGNKALDEDKNQKPDPVGIYYIQPGQGKPGAAPEPSPEPEPPTPEPEPEGPPAPTEGRIKNWGGDITKGAKGWKVQKMKDNVKLYKVVDANGKNIADLFSSTDTANRFIAYHIFKQGKDAETGGGGGTDPGPTPGGKGEDKNGVKLLIADGSVIKYDFKENFRDDGKRFDFNIGQAVQSEVTGYFRFKSNPVDDEVSIKWSEMSHSGSNNVQCYDSGVEIKTGKARLRFENPHPNYSGSIGSGQGVALKDKWIGYKGTKTVSGNSVTIKLYQDTGDNEGTKPANQWKEIFSHTDTKYKRTGAHPYVTIRVDDPGKDGQKNLEAKWLSAATIK